MLVTDDNTGVNVGANSIGGHYGFGLSSNGTLIEETVCVGGVNDGRACCKLFSCTLLQ